MTIRSYLFIPGDSERKQAKAREFGADALILDLEDSVAPDRKAAARGMVRAFLDAAPAPARAPKLVVRINALGTGMAAGDLAAVAAGRPDAILLPKCAGQADLDALGHMLDALEAREGLAPGAIRVLALVTETANAVLAMASNRVSHARLDAVTWGAEDLSSDLGALSNRAPDGRFDDAFRFARSVCLLTAAAAGLPAIDTVFTDIRDAAGFEEECRAARRMGFVAKTAIHPSQVEPINRLFSPSAEELGWARRVVAAFEAAPASGVLTLDGKMLDVPHLRLARRLLGAA